MTQPSPEAANRLMQVIGEGEPDPDEQGATDCPQGCEVEPDGTCPHGYESASLTLGVI